MSSKLLILDGLMQGDLDANFFRIVNLDTSNLPPVGIPPTINPPASNWLDGWDATLQEWSYSRPDFRDLSGFLTTVQMSHITQVGIVRVGSWQASPIAKEYLPSLDGITPPVLDVSLNNRKIRNLADPSLPQDAVNKRFMDALLQGLNPKEAVRVATTADVSLHGIQTIDGVTLIAGDRVLVKDNSADPLGSEGPENGIYVVGVPDWTRSADCNTADEINRAYVHVNEGTLNGGTSWVQVDTVVTINVDDVKFVIFSEGNDFLAGNGLSFSGNILNVGGTTDRISVSADAVDIAANYAGQTSITTLGTITDGLWNGDIISPAFGGTGNNNSYGITLVGPFATELAGLAVPGTPCTLKLSEPTIVELPPAGRLASLAGVETFINKRITKRVVKIATAVAPVINTDSVDVGYLSNLSTDPNMSTNLGGTPTDSQELAIWLHDNGVARTITWGAKFTAPSEVALPTTTSPGFWNLCKFMFSTEKNQWVLTDALSQI